MIIKEKKNYTKKFFSNMAQGEVFMYQGEYYIKTEILDEYNANCIELKTGNSDIRLDGDVVYKVKCRLVIG